MKKKKEPAGKKGAATGKEAPAKRAKKEKEAPREGTRKSSRLSGKRGSEDAGEKAPAKKARTSKS